MSVLDRFRLDGKRALITGGSRGLGLAMATAFAEAGADLVLVGREPATLEAARASLAPLKRRVDLIAADISTPPEAERTWRGGEELTVTLTAKQISPRGDADHGEVRWDAVVVNTGGTPVATYDVLTMVAKTWPPSAKS